MADQHDSTETLRAAVAQAQRWTGIDWDGLVDVARWLAAGKDVDPEEIGSSWVADDGSTASQQHRAALRRLARQIRQARDADMSVDSETVDLARELADEEMEYVARRASMASDLGDLAVEAAESGDWDEAVRLLDEACSIERAFGDDPSWSRPRKIAEAARDAAAETVAQS